MRALVIVGLLLIAGCDGTGASATGDYSCSAAWPGVDGGTSTPALCLDISGGTAQDLANNRQQCAAEGNTFFSAPCPHAGALGGCREVEGGLSLTTWYYDDGSSTASDIQSLCQGLASAAPSGLTITFVLP
jgi:hypothetical protein